MTSLAPTLEAFFTQRLYRQRQASPNTISSYRDTFRLLLIFAEQHTGKPPSRLDLEDLDAELISGFLDHLEHDRNNTVRTRNARMAAIRSMFRFAAYREPAHAEQIQRVLAIPDKRTHRPVVTYLSTTEIDALLAAPDRNTWLGRRDHALLVTALQTGLRVSELSSLRTQDLTLGAGAHIHCTGKNRKDRCTPLTRHTTAVLTTWLTERHRTGGDALFPTSRGGHLNRASIGDLVDRHVTTASHNNRAWAAARVTPHTLRHTAAMTLLAAGVETSVIALWLGHENVQTTQIYLHGDLTMKQKALDRTKPPGTPTGRYKPPDTLLAFLESL